MAVKTLCFVTLTHNVALCAYSSYHKSLSPGQPKTAIIQPLGLTFRLPVIYNTTTTQSVVS